MIADLIFRLSRWYGIRLCHVAGWLIFRRDMPRLGTAVQDVGCAPHEWLMRFDFYKNALVRVNTREGNYGQR